MANKENPYPSACLVDLRQKKLSRRSLDAPSAFETGSHSGKGLCLAGTGCPKTEFSPPCRHCD